MTPGFSGHTMVLLLILQGLLRDRQDFEQPLSDPENGLDKPSAADAFQVRSVSHIRFVRRLGSISAQALQDVTRALATVLSIS